MIPTKLQVLDAARFHLGDDQVSGGTVFTDIRLEQPFNLSYRELFRALQGLSNPRVRRVAFYNLPPNTSILYPETAGITDMGELEYIEERGGVVAVPVTSVAIASGTATITAPGHPFATGDQAALYGIGGIAGLAGMFGVTVSGATFVPNGALAVGIYVPATGVASKSSERFTPVDPVTTIFDHNWPGSGTLGHYAWREDALHFPSCNSLRQLRITYISSAGVIVNLTDTTGVDDSLDFLAVRTASIAAASRGARERGAALTLMALGPNGQADGTGGILRELVAQGVRALQNNPMRMLPFRPKRTPVDYLY